MATPRQIEASEFQAKCVALMDDVQETGVPIVVTKRGRPVVRIEPAEPVEIPSLLGSVSYDAEDDVMAPIGAVWFDGE